MEALQQHRDNNTGRWFNVPTRQLTKEGSGGKAESGEVGGKGGKGGGTVPRGNGEMRFVVVAFSSSCVK